MTDSEIEKARAAKLLRWQETWRSRWKAEGPPDYELTAGGDIAKSEWEREFLECSRTPDRERQRLNRITQEFSTGFERLYRLGPAVTVFGSDTMKVSRFARGLVSAISAAELKFWIERTDLCALSAPNGSGIGRRERR